MADTKLTALSETSVPALADLAYSVDVSDTTDDPAGSSRSLSLSRLLGLCNHACQGRLTLESGVPVSVSDQTGKTNVYFTPYGGSLVSIWDGTRWKMYSFTELTLALGTLSSGANYDVFLYDSSGTLTLKLGPAWSSDTARGTGAGTTELDTQDGVYVNKVAVSGGPGAKAGRYLGTIRTTSTTTTEDSLLKRFAWNAQCRALRPIRVTDATSSWTYGSTTIRQARASAANQVALVAGLAVSPLYLHVGATSLGTTSAVLLAGIGEDSTTALAAECAAGNYPAFVGGSALIGVSHNTLSKTPAAGCHYYPWLEACSAASTCTAFGDDTSALRRCGINGTWEC